MTPEHKAKMAAGRERAAASKRLLKNNPGKKLVPVSDPSKADANFVQPPTAPLIDYDALAEAMLRAQAKAAGDRANGVPMPAETREAPVQKDDRGMAVQPSFDQSLVRGGDSPVRRILSQLVFPADKTSQVLAMIAANMAPSVDMNDPQGAMFPALQERAVLEHMKEYVMTLRPELPHTRLVPQYKLYVTPAGEAPADAVLGNAK